MGVREEEPPLDDAERVRQVWAFFNYGVTIARLRAVVTQLDMVARRGPNPRRGEELRLAELLARHSAGEVVRRFAVLATQEERT